MPRTTLRLRYLTLKPRALSWLCGGSGRRAFLGSTPGNRQTGHIQEIAIADGREAMPKRDLINGSFSLFA
jgi:hypothetical protein